MTAFELDVQEIPKPQRHPLILDRFANLAEGDALVLINSHDPRHLREEFEREYPDGFAWEYVESGPGTWRVRIGKSTATGVPRVLRNAYALVQGDATSDAVGAVWTLEMSRRDLDANLIRLQAMGQIASHRGPDLDVFIFVVAGAGELVTSLGRVPLAPGDVAWLPRKSERSLVAGPNGLSYITVHPRRPALGIAQPPSIEPGRIRP